MLLRLSEIFFIFSLCAKYSEQGCVPPEDTEGGYFEPYQTNYEYGEKINYTCNYGHYHAGGTLTRTCQGFPAINAYVWTGSTPNCALIDCNEPTIPNAVYETPEATTYRSIVSYKCDGGLAPLGTLYAECMADGVWKYTPCEEPEFHCPPPPEVSNARPNVSETKQQHGTAIHYSCNNGYAMQGTYEPLICQQTTWIGSLPICGPIDTDIDIIPISTQPTSPQPILLTKNALSIVAGVVTAVILTIALTITVLILRKRQKKSERKRKSDQANMQSMAVSLPPATSTPVQHRHLQPGEPIKPNDSGTFTRCSAAGMVTTGDLTLPYHMIQCPHDHRPTIGAENRKRNNYVPDGQFRPLFSSYEQAQSSSPSTVQSDVSTTEPEFHTIRECLGDFKNNNVSNSQSTMAQTLPASSQNVTLTHPPNLFAHGSRASAGPFTRTLWTPDGRPYEAVKCEHGVEHVYQPLEHIYEEPHIWMRPLPDPQHQPRNS
ncbi:sushi domain-containing protein 4-like [Watersipora subatra]|uniref:sushi domain-containing protein 4-like n=1 Tax=Watersipora subatra TaxID=2589382 RepID=UPI00355C334A